MPLAQIKRKGRWVYRREKGKGKGTTAVSQNNISEELLAILGRRRRRRIGIRVGVRVTWEVLGPLHFDTFSGGPHYHVMAVAFGFGRKIPVRGPSRAREQVQYRAELSRAEPS
jgi:hypothetical protein